MSGSPTSPYGASVVRISGLTKTVTPRIAPSTIIFNAENTTQEGLDLYVALLKQNGFVRKYSSSDEVLYKDLGGEYPVFGDTDAFGTAPVMSVSMVRTKDRSEIEC